MLDDATREVTGCAPPPHLSFGVLAWAAVDHRRGRPRRNPRRGSHVGGTGPRAGQDPAGRGDGQLLADNGPDTCRW